MAGCNPRSKTCFIMLFSLLSAVGDWKIWKKCIWPIDAFYIVKSFDDINFLAWIQGFSRFTSAQSIICVCVCVCTDFRVDKHTCALSFYLRTSSIRFNRERKSYVFRNSHEKKICLYFKIVFMYGNSRLVLLVCLESQFKFINRLLCNNLLRY